MPEDNMELWDKVKTTDPDMTKRVDIRGGYTSIDPQYQLQQATELWGPYGEKWGLSDLKFTTIGEPESMTMMLEAMFHYPCDNPPKWPNVSPDYFTEFPIAVDMRFRPGDDCCKKLITSARSKALSYLGFGADVFMGKFDDEQYVALVRTVGSDVDSFTETALAKIKAVKKLEHLQQTKAKTQQMLADGIIGEDNADRLLEAIDTRWKELEK